jgi:peptidoglycan/xylan/chitin deacetylase (PgdA/CDA1 family)
LLLPISAAQATNVPLPTPLKYSACPPATPGVQTGSPTLPSGQKTVALTFDDGPGYDTMQIMAMMKGLGVRVTFLNNANHRFDELKAEYTQGFLAGSHTASHHYMAGSTIPVQTSEIERVILWQQGQTGTTPCVFRPAYGAYDSNTVRLVNAHNETFYLWNASGGDWLARGSGSQAWIDRIFSNATNTTLRVHNSNILMHDQPIHMPATVGALTRIVRMLQHNGYVFEDLLGRTGPPGVCGASTVPTPAVPATDVSDGTTVTSGNSLHSPNGQFTLEMKSDGNLVWRLTRGRTLWQSHTASHPGANATFSNGVLSVSSGSTLFSVPSQSSTGATLHLGDDGNLTITTGSATTWSSHTTYSSMSAGDQLKPNWGMYSPNLRCHLSMSDAGTLTLTDATGQTLFSNGMRVSSTLNPVTTLQSNGALETRVSGGGLIFSTWTSTRKNDHVVLTDSGHFAVIGAGGNVVWSTQ